MCAYTVYNEAIISPYSSVVLMEYLKPARLTSVPNSNLKKKKKYVTDIILLIILLHYCLTFYSSVLLSQSQRFET